jgi:hypothetical protein
MREKWSPTLQEAVIKEGAGWLVRLIWKVGGGGDFVCVCLCVQKGSHNPGLDLWIAAGQGFHVGQNIDIHHNTPVGGSRPVSLLEV